MNFLLDATAILSNSSFKFDEKHNYYITPQIVNEFKDMRSRLFLESALRFHNLKIVEPEEEFMREAEKMNKNFELGVVDVSIVALAIEFKTRGIDFAVVTDNKKLQKLLASLHIKFEGVIR